MLERSKTHLWLPFGIGILTMFFGMLRPGEFSRLDRQHVRVPAADRPEAGLDHVLLALVNPKNAAAMGRLQTVLVEGVLVVSWLEWLVKDLTEAARLFPSSGSRFLTLLQLSLKDLGLEGLGLTPGGLRPGGATYRFRKGEEISRLRFSGRRRSLQSFEHYVYPRGGSQLGVDEHAPKIAQTSSKTCAPLGHLPQTPSIDVASFFRSLQAARQVRRWSRAGTAPAVTPVQSDWDTDCSEDPA